MTPHHHPDDATLMSFAAGSLGQVFCAVVAAHIWGCTQCKRELRYLSAIGSVMMQELPPADIKRPIPMLTLQTFEATIEGGAAFARPDDADVPLPLAPLVGHRVGALDWRPLSPGIQHHPLRLPGEPSGSLRFLKVAGGQAIADHGHTDAELTLVLRGGYRDGTGAYAVGDLSDCDETDVHSPVADPEGCICLIASDGPPRFRSLFGRLVGPLLGWR